MSPEEHCIALLIADPHGAADLVREANLTEETFTDPRHREIYRQVMPFLREPGLVYSVAGLAASLDSESRAQVESLGTRLRSGPSLSDDMRREDLIKGLLRLRKQEIARSIEELRFLQQEAQESGEQAFYSELTGRLAALTAEYLRVERRFQAATYTGRRQVPSAGQG